MKSIKIEISFTENIVKQAACLYIYRGLGPGSFVAMALLLLAALYSFFAGERGVITGIFVGASLVLSLLVMSVYFFHYRRGLATLRRMQVPHAVIELTDAEFRVTSQAGTFATGWATFSELWRFQDIWLLLLGPGQYITLPVENLTNEAQNFIIRCFGSTGRKIK